MSKYILSIGDEIVANGSKEELLIKYNSALKVYKESGGRPSKEPNIWKLDKCPKK